MTIESLKYAIERKPDYAEAHALLGSCYYAFHALWKAIDAFTDAAWYNRNGKDFKRECMTARAHCHLAKGEYATGFEEYEYRLKEPNTWDGTQSLVGKTLLVKAEGGLGDQIFFYRYDELLGALGAGYVIWEVDEPLKDYFGSMVVVRGKEIPDHDYMVHAGSLPFIFGTKMGTIPVHNAKPSFVENPKRIGIACSGNPLHPDDHHRSIPLIEFKPIINLKKDFYFVQKDIRASDMHDHGSLAIPYYEDVWDIAALINDLDLVITVDTMTAHLAGAEGVPTWLLLPYACDWRWGLEGDRSPWYPSMKIFRQGPDREWGPVIQRVVEELKRV